MVFSNLVFLFIFLPIVIIVYYIVPRIFRNVILLIASLFFYAWGEPTYVFLMIFSIVMNYIFGLVIDKLHNKKAAKKATLVLSVIGNLLILGYFKYATFFVNNVNELFGTQITIEPIALPIGISFFTFQAMSYVIDVYRKDVDVQKRPIDLALYISLFPQLVAGPIVRYNTVNNEIKKRFHNFDLFADGVRRFIIGLAKKVILANPLGEIADAIFSTPADNISVATAWIGILAYTLQIYFDFSGYSDMAIGLGKMFGFKFLENFNYPYIAQSISDFWRRWHISLSSWFRDYVYIPLGGNRVSTIKIYRNLLIVWTITGFWHGASWTFMAWGFYYGIIISIERLGLAKILQRIWQPIRHVYVLFIVMIGWVFFRADNFAYSFKYIQTLFGINNVSLADNTTIWQLHDHWYVLLLGVIFSMPIFPYIKERLDNPFIRYAAPLGYLSLLFIVTMYLVNSTYNPFIYFRF